MRPKSIPQDQNLLFSSRLSTQLKPDHELLKLAKSIPWEQLEADTTVMPKAISHPVDAKLVQRSIARIVHIARATGIRLKRSYRRVSR